MDDLPDGRIRIAALYGVAALMHFTAQQFEAMSVWQFTAQMVGWAKQFEHSGMSDTEKQELWDWLQEKDDVPLMLGRGKANGKTIN